MAPLHHVPGCGRADDPSQHDTPEAGQSLVEYALILALIAIVSIVALVLLSESVVGLLSTVGHSV